MTCWCNIYVLFLSVFPPRCSFCGCRSHLIQLSQSTRVSGFLFTFSPHFFQPDYHVFHGCFWNFHYHFLCLSFLNNQNHFYPHLFYLCFIWVAIVNSHYIDFLLMSRIVIESSIIILISNLLSNNSFLTHCRRFDSYELWKNKLTAGD